MPLLLITIMVQMPQFSLLIFVNERHDTVHSFQQLLCFFLLPIFSLSVVEHIGPQHGVVEGVHHATWLVHVGLRHS